jgi:hypothetical protein
MPTGTLVIVLTVAAIFILFAGVLAWGERRTRGLTPHFYGPRQAPAE